MAQSSSISPNGFVVSDASKDKVAPVFRPVVRDVVASLASGLGDTLHSIYLYGSVPRGRATPGSSDLDVLVCLVGAERPDLEQQVHAVGTELSKHHAHIVREVGCAVTWTDDVASPAHRDGLGFFMKVLCVCVHGEDLRVCLPQYRPTSAVALALNGDVAEILASIRARIEDCSNDSDEVSRLIATACRKIIRSAFGMVMAREAIWTADRVEAADAFLRHFPEHRHHMAKALQWAVDPPDSREEGLELLRTFGGWIADNFHREAVKGPHTA
jgi:predicted nucleotidyltransferase